MSVKTKFKFEAHRPINYIKRFQYPVCVYCGLVYLNNSFSRWCIKTGCNHEDHKQYKYMMKVRKA